jgi:hypothetical protein
MEHVGLFDGHLVILNYGHLEYFVVVYYSWWTFGIFFPFWYVVLRNIWQPW